MSTGTFSDLLQDLDNRVVVIGGVSRSGISCKDLDLLYDYDSDIAYNAINKTISKYDFPWTSSCPGNWTFPDQRVEILPVHYGSSYRSIRRGAYRALIIPFNVELWIADKKHVDG